MTKQTRLNEYDKREWREVAQLLCPDWTEEKFEEAWAEFLELKRQKRAQ